MPSISPTVVESLPAIEPVSFKSQLRPQVTETPLTIDGLVRQRSQESPHTPIVSYPSSGIQYVDYTYQQLNVFALRAARRYASLIPSRSSSAQSESVIGLLGPSNLDYFITTLALTKLGHTVLFLSTRISREAYISLLRETGARSLLIHASFEQVATDIQKALPDLQDHRIIDQSSYDYPVENNLPTKLDGALDPVQETKRIAWIIHSSGSTGLPKPIYQTHGAALNNYGQNMGMKGFITLPLYHAHGLSSVFRAIDSRKQIHLYNAALPLTQQYLSDILCQHTFEIFYGVPYALKLLGETPEGIEILSKLNVVMFGGSACPDELGNTLVSNGVNLISHYGTTETGQLMTSFRPVGDKGWDYVRPSVAVQPYLRWEQRSLGVFELCVLDGWPSKVASNRPDGSYATKDLFTPHPTTPNAWKYYARLDDTIVLMNGEKANPLNIEGSVRQHANVTEAVVFGSGKPRLGMMVVPSRATLGLTSEAILESIWTTIASANSSSPGYAKISKDMVGILGHGTEYPRTDKGTVIRQAFYKAFSSKIDLAYEEASAAGTLVLSELELRTFIRSELFRTLELRDASTIADDTDFFSVGVDSLQTTQLRDALVKNLDTGGKRLGQNIVFEYPSINSLAKALFELRTGVLTETNSVEDQMQSLIEKYGQFKQHKPKPNSRNGQFIVVTGATGSLGAHVVSQLVCSPSVERVYCLVRARCKEVARIRVVKSMRERQLYHTISLKSRRKIHAVPANFADDKLGLDSETYADIVGNITGMIHCAWSVNFNLGLGSFEKDCIAGAKHLIGLCLKSQRPVPAWFSFCSSVSAVASTKGEVVPEALPAELSYAQGMGYAQSKLVTEHICCRAAEQTGIKSRVLRVGQVIADTVHGIWNSTEAIPMMLQTATTIGAVPKLDENPLWLPVDVVARTVIDISISDADAGVMNVANHNSFHWTKDLLPACHKAGLQFEEIPQKDWVNRLRKSNSDPAENPPIKLVEFFATKYDNDKPRKSLQYKTDVARNWSPTLSEATVLDQRLVDKLIKYLTIKCWNVSSTPSSTPWIKGKVVVIAGPCGAGKSTVARGLSHRLSVPWIEGDSLHSVSSLKKMSSGEALLDADRAEWLDKIAQTANGSLVAEEKKVVIVTCSSLKRTYRDRLRQIGEGVETLFVALQGDEDVLATRVSGRQGHFMKKEMVQGQLAITEDPDVDELDVIPFDVDMERDVLLEEVIAAVGDACAF